MKSGRSKRVVGLMFAICWFSNVALADVYVADYFGPHMVLQRDEPIIVWGTADPGQAFSVRLGENTIVTRAGEQGHWTAEFAARPASIEPIALSVGDTRIEDILIGDVWLNSGQSNMAWPLNRTDAFDAQVIESNPHLRLMQMLNPRAVAKDGYTDDELARSNVNDFFAGQWEISDADSAASFSSVAWVMGNNLSQELGVPIGLVQIAVGGSAINNWLPPALLRQHPHTAHLYRGDWLENDKVHPPHRRRAREAFQKVLIDGESFRAGQMPYRWMCEPGFLYEAGIEPLKLLSFKGVTWYQGETDATHFEVTHQYRDLLPLLIQSWRASFSDDSLPFIIVQLPRYNVPTWPMFRHLQAEVADQVDNTSLVIALDTGSEDNIHPFDKLRIGERVALAALDDIYRRRKILSYPEPASIRLRADRIRLKLRYFDTGRRGEEAPGFEVGDQYGNFWPASAEFSAKNRIDVQSPVDCPRFLRYGWFPYLNNVLVSADGMPVAPFRVELEPRRNCD